MTDVLEISEISKIYEMYKAPEMSEITEQAYSRLRKVKHTKKQKKEKKYEPKSQKRNLNKSRCHKIINTQIDVLHDNKDALTELIEILNSEDANKWDNNCELLYKEYNLVEIKECKMGYDSIQYKLSQAQNFMVQEIFIY
jgi:hypothetical protein